MVARLHSGVLSKEGAVGRGGSGPPIRKPRRREKSVENTRAETETQNMMLMSHAGVTAEESLAWSKVRSARGADDSFLS